MEQASASGTGTWTLNSSLPRAAFASALSSQYSLKLLAWSAPMLKSFNIPSIFAVNWAPHLCNRGHVRSSRLVVVQKRNSRSLQFQLSNHELLHVFRGGALVQQPFGELVPFFWGAHKRDFVTSREHTQMHPSTAQRSFLGCPLPVNLSEEIFVAEVRKHLHSFFQELLDLLVTELLG